MWDADFTTSLRLSIQVACVATLLVAVVGLGLAWLFATIPFRGKELLDLLVTLPLVLPPTVVGYYLIVLFGREGVIGFWLDHWLGISVTFHWSGAVLASFVVALPLMVKTTRAALEAVDSNLIAAAYTLGHSRLETAFRVTFPLARRGIFAGLVLAFARAIGEFGATLMLAGNIPGKTATMPLSIFSAAASGEWSRTHAYVVVLTAFSALFLALANRYGRPPESN